jgi:U4/U6 small nuclear ribonucleoprotein PRP3
MLSDPSHRFKVRRNAEQNNLTGVCIFNPSFSVVYVEGAPKYMRAFKKLMLRRIAWTEPARPRGGEEIEVDRGDEDIAVGSNNVLAEGQADAASLEDNQCWLVWEGTLRERAFSGFKPKSCPTDASAKDVLGPKLAGYWDMSKNWKPEEEQLL